MNNKGATTADARHIVWIEIPYKLTAFMEQALWIMPLNVEA
jgi:hypothetical protein